jgi:hypothetical protein
MDMSDRELDALVAEEVMEWRWRAFKSDRNAPKWAKDIYPPDAIELEWPDEPGAPPLAELPYLRSAHYLDMPHYSSDIAAAWQVVEKMRENWFIAISTTIEGGWMVIIRRHGYSNTLEVTSIDSAPRAICLAVLKALGVEVDDGR